MVVNYNKNEANIIYNTGVCIIKQVLIIIFKLKVARLFNLLKRTLQVPRDVLKIASARTLHNNESKAINNYHYLSDFTTYNPGPVQLSDE